MDLSVQSQQVRNVTRAVTQNGVSILLTGLMTVIIIYVYSMIAFFTLRDAYSEIRLDCSTIFQCFFSTLSRGIVHGGGIAETFEQVIWGERNYFLRLFFDLTFFILIIILGLNIIFGIILDTFGELRDERQAIEHDMKDKCFICSIESSVFQRQKKTLGFKHHIKHDHNMWHYIYFFIYLDSKDKDEFTHLEEYVYHRKIRGEIDYFPISRAISLDQEKENNTEQMIAYLYNKAKAQENTSQNN